MRAKEIDVEDCPVFKQPLAYFFYGRPAYRVADLGAIKLEAACPYCFIFDGEIIRDAKEIFAFDTGAFEKRLYKHVVDDDMNVGDFSLENDVTRPGRLISRVFATVRGYFDGTPSSAMSARDGAKAWNFLAKAYLHLLESRGRNEPDDRICSIEVVFGKPVPFDGNLKAVVVPHTLWDGNEKAPWLIELETKGVQIVPYAFIPGKNPEYYHALLEEAVRDLYDGWGLL